MTGKQLFAMRKRLGMSQEALAARLDEIRRFPFATASCICRWETGNRAIDQFKADFLDFAMKGLLTKRGSDG